MDRRRFLGLGTAAAGATSIGRRLAEATEAVPRRGQSDDPAYEYLTLAMDAFQRGATPRLIQSFSDAQQLGSTAFVYDNSLAILACRARGQGGDVSRAMRLGDSFLYAQAHDPGYADGRVRQAYWVGPFTLPFTQSDSYFVRTDGSVSSGRPSSSPAARSATCPGWASRSRSSSRGPARRATSPARCGSGAGSWTMPSTPPAWADTPQSLRSNLRGNLWLSGVTFSDVSRRSTDRASPSDALPDPDAVWLEGTAHMAAALRARQRPEADDLPTFHGDATTAAEYLAHVVLARNTLGRGQTVNGVRIPDGSGVVAAASVLDTGTGFSYYPNLHLLPEPAPRRHRVVPHRGIGGQPVPAVSDSPAALHSPA